MVFEHDFWTWLQWRPFLGFLYVQACKVCKRFAVSSLQLCTVHKSVHTLHKLACALINTFITILILRRNQCCGFRTFWCWSGSGSGSADPCLWLMDPDPDSDPDPSIFVIGLQDANKKLIKKKVFLLITFWRFTTSFTKIKSQKEVTK